MKHNEDQKKQLRLPCIVDQINRIRDLVIISKQWIEIRSFNIHKII